MDDDELDVVLVDSVEDEVVTAKLEELDLDVLVELDSDFVLLLLTVELVEDSLVVVAAALDTLVELAALPPHKKVTTSPAKKCPINVFCSAP